MDHPHPLSPQAPLYFSHNATLYFHHSFLRIAHSGCQFAPHWMEISDSSQPPFFFTSSVPKSSSNSTSCGYLRCMSVIFILLTTWTYPFEPNIGEGYPCRLLAYYESCETMWCIYVVSLYQRRSQDVVTWYWIPLSLMPNVLCTPTAIGAD